MMGRPKLGNRHGATFVVEAVVTVVVISSKPVVITCLKCYSEGHNSDKCTSCDTSEVVCWNCGGTGHYSNECPSEAKKERTHKKEKPDQR